MPTPLLPARGIDNMIKLWINTKSRQAPWEGLGDWKEREERVQRASSLCAES